MKASPGSSSATVMARCYQLELAATEGGWRLRLPGLSAPVLSAPGMLMLAPIIAGGQAHVGKAMPPVVRNLPDGGREVLLQASLAGLGGWVENRLLCLDDRIICTARYLAEGDHRVAHWQVLGRGATLGLPSVHAFVGEGTKNLDGTFFATDNLAVSTASHNFQHWNAAPRLLFTDGRWTVAAGGTRLAHDYGLELKTGAEGAIDYLRFNYGGEQAPHPGRSGAVQAGPRLQLQISAGLQPLAVQARFTEAMITDGVIPRHHYLPEHEPWRRPWYCTWPDQVLLAQTLTGDADWKGQRPANAVLTQKLVERAVARIREWNLNIGTIVIDAGWQDKRGDWNLDTDKFPDFRGLVNRLHDWGYKVHVWWAPLQVEQGAAVLERTGFTYPLAPGNEHALDYTNPDVRDYTAEKVERWFSSAAGGWDLDGLKLDWLCERIRPVAQPADPDWRGEERQLVKLQRLLCDLAARHKDAFAISSQPRNPQMANLSFTTGIPENFADDLVFPLESLPALKAWMPEWWIKAHAIYQPERVAEHVRLVRALDPDAIPEIGLALPETMPDACLAAVREALRPGIDEGSPHPGSPSAAAAGCL